MSADVVSLASHRRNHEPARQCGCDLAAGWTCYPHRLVELMVQVEDMKSDVENFRFVDLATFDRLTDEVLHVLGGITAECLPPNERTAR